MISIVLNQLKYELFIIYPRNYLIVFIISLKNEDFLI